MCSVGRKIGRSEVWFGRFARQTLSPPSDLDGLISWAMETVKVLGQLEFNLISSLNGRLEFPTPFNPGTNNSGNLRVSYALLDVSATGNYDVDHGFAGSPLELPRGMFIADLHDLSADTLILDQVLSSSYPSPTVAGYTTANVTSATVVAGEPAGTANGWSGNGIVANDEILIEGDSEWRRIKAVTAGTPDTLTLAQPTTVSVATGYNYVIRRRGNLGSTVLVTGGAGRAVALLAYY